ncbi:hypothetical protein [Paraburkholderia kururiensis]|uniref:hypothetical protein n=1 Tax=Paraburkholderia kururiensis TaxID=984307 RepID=UPI0039A51730
MFDRSLLPIGQIIVLNYELDGIWEELLEAKGGLPLIEPAIRLARLDCELYDIHGDRARLCDTLMWARAVGIEFREPLAFHRVFCFLGTG